MDAFDISEAGIAKAKKIAQNRGISVNFCVNDLSEFIFTRQYDAILSHGVLHLPEKEQRDKFIREMQANTHINGYNFVGIFTNKLPATPDNEPFTKSLFDVGELPDMYAGWEILIHREGTLSDEHPGGIKHEHAYEGIIARKMN